MGFREEEKYQTIEAFAEMMIDEFEESMAIDGLPCARSEGEAEAMSDVRAYVENRTAMKEKIVKTFLETWKRLAEIEAQ